MDKEIHQVRGKWLVNRMKALKPINQPEELGNAFQNKEKAEWSAEGEKWAKYESSTLDDSFTNTDSSESEADIFAYTDTSTESETSDDENSLAESEGQETDHVSRL